MENNCLQTTPKVIVYEYLFNYFGGDEFAGKIINGASLDIAIHVFKGNDEIKFTEEPSVDGESLFDIIRVSFDREQDYRIDVDVPKWKKMATSKGWTHFSAEVIGHNLSYWIPPTAEIVKLSETLPDELKRIALLCAEVMDVTETEFRTFLKKHQDDFDISDNYGAQVPSYWFI